MKLICLFLLTLLYQSQAQNHAIVTPSLDPARRCHYTFTVASPDDFSCSESTTKPQLDGVLSRLSVLEAVVSRLIGGKEDGDLQENFSQVAKERKQLEQEKEKLSKQVQELKKTLANLSQEAETLRQRPCQQTEASGEHQGENGASNDPADDSRNGVFQEMKAEVTEFPASHLLDENDNLTGCGELVWVGEPVLHKKADGITGKYGVWLQDPEPEEPYYSNVTVWRVDAVGKDVRQLFVYEDLDHLSRGFPMKVLMLPEPLESTGATVYRGSFYYQRRRTRTLIRYDLASETVASRQDLPLASFHGQHPYSWGGYTDIDLAADEQGLWAIYSTSKAKGAIVVSLLDPTSLEVKKSWETKIRKRTVANAFMICGRLYTVGSYMAANTSVNYMFDTASGRGAAISVPFQNKYGYNSMVDYNHAQRKLFAWDNFHMVTYDVRLGRASRGSS